MPMKIVPMNPAMKNNMSGSAIATAAMLGVLLALWFHARVTQRKGEMDLL